MAATGPNTIYYELVIEASEFMSALRGAEGAALSFDEIMATMKVQIKAMMDEFGIDAPTAIRVLQSVRGEIGMTAEELTRLQEIARQAALKQVGDDFRNAESAGISFASTLRMIEGVIVSMVIFQFIQMLSQAFQDATKNAMDYYQALQNITVAQSALAQQGVAVTNQQLLDIVSQLSDKWKTISQVDITAAVAQAGLMASEFHLSVDQMTQLADEAAILHQLDPSKPMADYVVQLAKALEGGRSLALNGEQIAITNDELLAKAKELNLVADDYKGKLTDQQKIAAGLAIEFDRLHPEEAKLLQEIKDGNSALVQSEEATKQWADMMTVVGASLEGAVVQLKEVGVAVVGAYLDFIRWLQPIQSAVEGLMTAGNLVNVLAALSYAVQQIWAGNVHSIHDFANAIDDALAKMDNWVAKMYEAQKLGDWRNLGKTVAPGSGLDFTNTPVSPGGNDVTGASTIDESKLQGILDSVAKDYQNYYDSVQKATENFNTRMQDLQDRYNLQVQNEVQNTNLRMAQEKQNFRLKELQQEQDFQQKMRELQDKYLMDLEDALRKRDAEAVIKIIERYNMEKTTAQQQESIKQQQDKQNERLKLEQMKQEEDLRLSQMKAEFQLQQTEATRAYDQQLADLRTSLDTKLQEEAVKAQQDLGLNQSSIDAIYKLFTEYYGSGGKFAQTQQSSYTQMIQQSQGFVNGMAAIMQEYAAVLSSLGAGYGTIGEGSNAGGYGSPTPGGGGGGSSARRFATGGMALAASATDVTFGEAGPELAMFLPLNASAGAMQMSGLGGGGGGFGGQAVIALQLDPNLEARIVNTTLTHAAISIHKVYGGSR